MSDVRLDEQLQDYLDDRLSGPERAAFEKRLESDPDLASRLEAYRSVGRALRDTSEELPPGFYARARERFETVHAPRSGWRFLLRWEAIGVAAAGLLLVAVMLPDIMRGDRLDLGAPTLAPAQESAPVRTSPPVEDEPAKPQDKVLHAPGVDAGKDAPVDKRDVRRREGAPAPPLPDATAADDDEAGADREVLERDSVAVTKQKRQEDAKKSARLDAAEPAAPPAEREQNEVAENLGRVATYGMSDAGVVPFAGAGIEVGGVIVVEDDDAWNDLPVGVRRALGRPDFSSRRLVLIGPREGAIRCASLEIVTETDRVVIRVPLETAGPGDEACAVTVPVDGRRIEVVDIPGADR